MAKATARPDVSALADLMNTRRAALGKTYRQMADESGLSVAFLHRIASGELARFPSPRTAEGLAAALELPLETITTTAGSDVGVHEFVLIDEGECRAIYHGSQKLSEKDRKLILDMVNRLIGADAP